MEGLLDVLDIRLAALCIAVLVVAATEIGFSVARGRESNPREDAPFSVAQTAAYGLAGLLLAFSFSLAVARYDARRQTLVTEANAIGTTIVRTDLLNGQTSSKMRNLLRQYVPSRLVFSAAGTNAAGRARAEVRSGQLQNQMWELTARAANGDPRSTTIPLFVQALNNTIDASGEESTILAATIPASVIFVLLALVLVAVGLMGFEFGRVGRRRPIVSLMLALMFALVIATILDLDRPQGGLIRINLKPLADTQQLLESRR